MPHGECRKFTANIFNKTKCTNCFRQKDEHSTEALESNRASRKIAKCGYLFVAPDWDFSNPVNKTKRWQRRWFVLFDDGELTYALDEHPETIPQAIIDMNKVMEVSEAESVTGNEFSLAIAASDRVHFVKGTCKEESKWWYDVLQFYPKSNMKSGRHKRNATFPGVKATKIPPQNSSLSPIPQKMTTGGGSGKESASERPNPSRCRQHNSVIEKPNPVRLMENATPDSNPKGFVVSGGGPAPLQEPAKSAMAGTEVANSVYSDVERPPCSESPPTQDKVKCESKARQRRVAKHEVRSRRSGRSISENISAMIPPKQAKQEEIVSMPIDGNNSLQVGNVPVQTISKFPQFPNQFSSLEPIQSVISSPIPTISPLQEPEISETPNRKILFEEYSDSKREEKLKNIADSITRPFMKRSFSYLQSIENKHHTSDLTPTRDNEVFESGSIQSSQELTDVASIIRGDPDGGNGIDSGPNSFRSSATVNLNLQNENFPIRVDLPAEDLLHIKKGWLMKQGLTKEWHKHWFVLRGTALMYYRDPTAEDNGILDGIVDLSLVQKVDEMEVARNYGFKIVTWDDKKYILSAVTHGIRGNWIQALRNAANLKDTKPLSEKIDRELSSSKIPDQMATPNANTRHHSEREESDSSLLTEFFTPNVNYSLLSSEEDFRTPSDSSQVFDWTNESNIGVTWQNDGEPVQKSRSSLSLSRTPISKIKDKCRSRAAVKNIPGAPKRSRSSPPGSRRTSRDDFHHTDEVVTSLSDKELDFQPSLDENRLLPEKDDSKQNISRPPSNTTITVSPCDSLLVDLLETEVESLKAQLEQTQGELFEMHQSRIDLTVQLRSNHYSYHDLETEHKIQQSMVMTIKRALHDANDMIRRQTAELGSVRRKLELCQFDFENAEKELAKEKEEKELSDQKSEIQGESIKKLEKQCEETMKKLETRNHELEEQNERLKEMSDLRQKYSDMLTKYNSLRQKWEEQGGAESWKSRFDTLQECYHQEHGKWEKELNDVVSQLEKAEEKSTVINDLTHQLTESESRIDQLLGQVEDLHIEKGRMSDNLTSKISYLESQFKEMQERAHRLEKNSGLLQNNLIVKGDEVSNLEKVIEDLNTEAVSKNEELQKKNELIEELLKENKNFENTLKESNDRLSRGIEENELLCAKIRELEDKKGNQNLTSSKDRFSSSKRNLTRMDSLSELSNFDFERNIDEIDKDVLTEEFSQLRSRFEKAIVEIRALKKNLKDSQDTSDDMEVINMKLKQDVKSKEMDFEEQMKMMTNRIQDLTGKLSISQKEVASLKQKLSKGDTKEKRRSQSLKGKESFQLSKEIESKLVDLECKLDVVEKIMKKSHSVEGDPGSSSVLHGQKSPATALMEKPGIGRRSKSFEESTAASRARRKSLNDSEPTQVLIKLNDLDSRLKKMNDCLQDSGSNLTKVEAKNSKQRKFSKKDSKLNVISEKPSVATTDNFSKEVFKKVQSFLLKCKTTLNLVECQGSKNILELHNQIDDLEIFLEQKKSGENFKAFNEEATNLVSKIQTYLKMKIFELHNYRDSLKSEGKLTNEKKLHIFVEKLACEAVVASELNNILKKNKAMKNFDQCMKSRLLVETCRRMEALQNKVSNNENCDTTIHYTRLDCLSKILCAKLTSLVNVNTCDNIEIFVPPQLDNSTADGLKFVLAKERQMSDLVTTYKEDKLRELANVLAFETFRSGDSFTSNNDNLLLEEIKIREAWQLAQEVISQELVQSELTHSMVRFANFSSLNCTPQELLVMLKEQEILESQWYLVESTLQQEMEEGILKLSTSYEKALSSIRKGEIPDGGIPEKSAENILTEFATVMAHKAITDAQLTAVQNHIESPSKVSTSSDSSAGLLKVCDAIFPFYPLKSDCDLSEVISDEAEFVLLMKTYSDKCTEDVVNISKNVNEQENIEKLLTSLKNLKQGSDLFQKYIPIKVEAEMNQERFFNEDLNWENLLSICDEIQKDVTSLNKYLEKYSQECSENIFSLNYPKSYALEKIIEEEKTRLFDSNRQKDLERRSSNMESVLTKLKREYENKIEKLKAASAEKLGDEMSPSLDRVEEIITLALKGFAEMDNSHRALALELEEKHQKEKEFLVSEKERALAEETQATLAALDAMRKAHEAEVQREISKFKEDFISKMKTDTDIGTVHREHHLEMEQAKREIISLNETLSRKSLDLTSLEDKVRLLKNQVSDCQSEVSQYEARNKILREQLAGKLTSWRTEEQQQVGAATDKRINVLEAEMLCKMEDISQLQLELRTSRNAELELSGMCRQLSQVLKAERQLRADEASSLQERLENIINTKHQEDLLLQSRYSRSGDTTASEPASVARSRREFCRSVSSPLLSSTQTSANAPPASGSLAPLKSPLSGMVANRKKVYEISPNADQV